MVMAAGLLTACDPSKDDVSVSVSSLTSQQLQDGFSFTQYGDEECTTEAQDGNYFTFFTSPSRVVSIYQVDAEGTKNILVSGVANGKFKIVPKRGNPTEQKFYIETLNFDGSTVTAEKTANVYVPSELTPEMRLLASDAYGKKIWKWDTEFRSDGGAWGNLGYAPADGDRFQTISLRNFPVLYDPDLPKFWKFQLSCSKHNISVYQICGIAILILMFGLESRKTHRWASEEVLICLFQMKLYICKSQ